MVSPRTLRFNCLSDNYLGSETRLTNSSIIQSKFRIEDLRRRNHSLLKLKNMFVSYPKLGVAEFSFGNFKNIKRTNNLFSNLCFPFPEFQVGRVAFNGINYYIFIIDTSCSPKPCQRFLKDRFVFILQTKLRNSTYVIEGASVLS